MTADGSNHTVQAFSTASGVEVTRAPLLRARRLPQSSGLARRGTPDAARAYSSHRKPYRMITVGGLLAVALTVDSWGPQVRTTWHYGRVGISPLCPAAFRLGVDCWLVYGLATRDEAIIAVSVVTLALVLQTSSLARFRQDGPRGGLDLSVLQAEADPT